MLVIIIARSQKPLFVIVKNSFERIDFLKEAFQVGEVKAMGRAPHEYVAFPRLKVKVKKGFSEHRRYAYHRCFLESIFEY